MKNLQYITITSLFFLFAFNLVHAQPIFTVTKTTDPDPFIYTYNNDDSLCDPEILGTLQWAIRKSNDTGGAAIINFNIPSSGPYKIKLNNYLPVIKSRIILDGTTQPGYVEGSPIINIEANTYITTCFSAYGVDELTIKGFNFHNFIACGISLENCNYSTISDNIITLVNSNYLRSKIGLVRVRLINCTNIEVYNNILNTSNDGSPIHGPANYGVAIYNSENCIIGADLNSNIIEECATGIMLDNSQNIRLTQNKIYGGISSILLNNGSNNNKREPFLLNYNNGILNGVAQANDVVEVFGSDDEDDATAYLGTVISDDEGKWSLETANNYTFFTATATDANNNTSELCKVGTANSLCSLPYNLTTTQGVNTTHTLSWETDNPDTEFQIAVGKKGISPLENEWMFAYTTVTSNSISLSGFDENTAYEFYIQELCDAGIGHFVGPVVFNFPATIMPEATKLTDKFCDATVYSNDSVEAILLSNVIGYKFLIMNENTGDELEIESTDNFISIPEIDYEIESETYLNIAVKGIYENMESDYGENCTVLVLPEEDYKPYADGKIIIRLNSDMEISYSDTMQTYPIVEIEPLINRYGITKISKLFKFMEDSSVNYPHVVHYDSTFEAEEIMSAFNELSFVKSVGYVPIYSYYITPNDPIYDDVDFWHLNQVNAESAWGIHQGADDVIVAVLDNGFNTTHEDLINNVWVNLGEIEGNGIDDDGNGYVDDYHGYDVGDNDGNPHINTSNGDSFYGHGTHVAGIAGAETNNLSGVASISYGTQLMLVKNSSGTGYFDHEIAIASLEYLVNNGIDEDVVNMSWGAFDGADGLSQEDIDDLYLPIETLFNNDIVLVAAVGNNGLELGNGLEHYPSSFSEVIAVGATNSDDMLAIQGVNNTTLSSNYGTSVDVMAPGVDIWSTMSGTFNTINDEYLSSSGTSMATPLVAGICALMRSYKPDATVVDIRNCLISTCDPIDAINEDYEGLLGSGRINAYEAIRCLMSEEILAAHFSASSQTSCESEPVTFYDESIGSPISWEWSVLPSDGVVFTSSNTVQNPDIIFTTPGYYTISLTVTDMHGNEQSITYYNYIFVQNPQVQMVASNHFCLNDGNIGFCLEDATMNSLDVCNGSTQTITLYFNGEPPFSAIVTDGLNLYDVNPIFYPCLFYPEYNYRASINVFVSEEYNTFSIVSLEDNVCLLENLENTNITFNIHDCCPNLLLDGDFEDVTEIPDNRTDLELISNDGHNEYIIFNNTSLNSHMMSIDGPTEQQVVDAGNTDEHLLWASTFINVSENTDYIFSSDNSSGCHSITYCSNLQTDWISSQQLKLSLKIVNVITNEILLSKIVYYPSRFAPEPRIWTTNNFYWHSDISQIVRIEIYQIEEFGPAFYDYLLDNISLRAINENTLLTSSIDGYTYSSSPSECDGSASVLAVGGHEQYVYEWSNSLETPNISNLCAGEYEVTVTDANLCSTISSIIIENLSNISINITSEDVSCFGLCDGSATVIADGGVEPYSYLWSNGEETPIISDLCAGDYEVTVTDANGDNNIGYITINQNDEITVTTSYSNVTCYGYSDGEASVDASGGTGTFTYSWNDLNTQVTPTAANLSEGSYNVIVTDGDNCQAESSVYINEPDQLNISAEIVSIPCSGMCSGSINCNTEGGISPYLYEWNYSAYQVTETAEDLCEDLYSITVYDQNGCSAIDDISLPAYENPNINMPTEEEICLGQSIPIGGSSIASGGSPTYTYLWDNDMFLDYSDISNPIATPAYTTPFTLTLIDINGCSATETVSVTVHQNPDINTSIDLFPNCPGANTTLTAVGSGGSSPYEYLWDGTETGSTYIVNPTINTDYSVVVEDINGCTNSATITAEIAYTENIAVINSCSGTNTGSIEIALDLHPLNSISNLFAYWTDLSPVPNALSPTPINVTGNTYVTNIIGLSEGTYSYTITDDLGCEITNIVEVLEMPAPTTIGTMPVASCPNEATGGIDITVTGGSEIIEYEWSNGDLNEDLTNVFSDSYTLSITDVNNCLYTVTDFVGEDPTVDIAAINTLASYNSTLGNTTLTFNSTDSNPYNIGVTDLNSDAIYQENIVLNNITLSDLDPGLYDVQAQSPNSCEFVTQFSIANVITTTSSPCYELNNGEITLEITVYGDGNGISTQVDWLNSSPTSLVIIEELDNQITYQTTLSSITAGDYTYNVVDDWENEISNTITVEFYEHPNISLITSSSCPNEATGGIDITVTGGSGIIEYEWSNGDLTEDLTNVFSDNYTLSITDINNCTYTVTDFVGEHPTVDIEAINTFASYDNASGNTTVTFNTNDLNPYEILITGPGNDMPYQTNSTLTNIEFNHLPSGLYDVQIQSQNSCGFTEQFSIANVQYSTEVACSEGNNGEIELNITVYGAGNTLPSTINWTDNNSNTFESDCNVITTQPELIKYQSILSGLTPGEYTFITVDSWGNEITNTVIIESYEVPTIEYITEESCSSTPTGGINIEITNGVVPISYLWSNGATTEDISGISSDIYTVTITYADNCEYVPDPISVEQYYSTEIIINWTHAYISPTAEHGNVNFHYSNLHPGEYTLFVTNNSTYSETFTFTADNQLNQLNQIDELPTGLYDMTLTDANGCFTTTQFSIDFVKVSAVNSCYGENDGQIEVVIQTFGDGNGIIENLQWQNGDFTEFTQHPGMPDTYNFTYSNLAPDLYVFTIHDLWGNSITSYAVVEEQPFIDISVSIVEPAYGDGLGIAQITLSPDDIDYTGYQVIVNSSTPFDDIVIYNPTSSFEVEIPQGDFSVTVNNTTDNCDLFIEYPFNMPRVDQINLDILDVTPAKCDYYYSGTITFEIFGGVPPYSINIWQGETQLYSNLEYADEGEYSVDLNNLSNIEGFVVTGHDYYSHYFAESIWLNYAYTTYNTLTNDNIEARLATHQNHFTDEILCIGSELDQTLILNDNVTFENCTIYTATHPYEDVEDTKVLIRAPYDLRLKNCVVESGCPDQMWQGIAAEGAHVMQSYDTHAMVAIEDGTTISDAMRAVELYSGAIIKASHSNFFNNQYDIYMQPHCNYQYISYINYNNFITNKVFKNPEIYPKAHVRLEWSKNLRLKGNTFKYEIILHTQHQDYYLAHKRGKGIESYLSSFIVTPVSFFDYNSFPANSENTFEGLYYAIDARGQKTYAPQVYHSEFKDNFRGVYLKGTNGARVLFNTISTTNAPLHFDMIGFSLNGTPATNVAYGAYLNNATNTKFEENTILNGKAGTYIYNLGDDGTVFYNNNFGLNKDQNAPDYNIPQGMKAATVVVGKNSNYVNGSEFFTGQTGLEVKCNDYTDNNYAISVLNGNMRKNQGISGGETDELAGNQFHETFVNGMEFKTHITSGSNLNFNYSQYDVGTYEYYEHNDLLPNQVENGFYRMLKDENISGVIHYPSSIHKFVEVDACPTHYNPRVIFDSDEAISSVFTIKSSLTNLEKEYDRIVDKGDRLYMKTTAKLMNYDNYNEAFEILQNEGYLSDTVLIALICNEIAPSDAISAILIENSPLPEKVVKLIEDLPVHNNIKNWLSFYSAGLSNRVELEYQISDMKQEITYLESQLLNNAINNDTLPEVKNNVISYFNSKPDITYKDRIGIYNLELSLDQIGDAQSTLTEIRSMANTLPADQAEEAIMFCDVNEIFLYSIDETKTDSDSVLIANKDLLFDAASRMSTEYSAMAEILYSRTTDSVFYEYTPLPIDEMTPKNMMVYENTNNIFAPEFKVYPNPTEGLVFVEYNFDKTYEEGTELLLKALNLERQENCNSGIINVYSHESKLINTISLDNINGLKTINLNKQPAGLYLIEIIDCYGNTNSVKIVKNK